MSIRRMQQPPTHPPTTTHGDGDAGEQQQARVRRWHSPPHPLSPLLWPSRTPNPTASFPPPPPCDGRRHPIQEAPDGGRQCPVAVEGEDVRHLVGRPVRHVGEEKMVAAVASDLVTPEKTEPRPLLRRAALELHRAGRGPAAEVDAGVDALESVERELGVGAGAYRRPVKRRPEFKLPESYEILMRFCASSSTALRAPPGSSA
ncbi:uncharacterized protein LOC123408505 [Hordeum vulgare subsp. vulgare]|uniref:uncharacterized protein LOC123408505 n=1 Tax=Hordeum vulgare subsp. vulgare TaxID=112509 RepID=UPI00162C2034|nr:uncharacterized protein LOC123408505 [Hordeum vulgare subsp. vulgare]